MSFWTLLQVIFDIVVCVGVALYFINKKKQPKEDPRLSRGLQLLQSKIAILEDLSDRTETQVKQLSALLEEKSRDVQVRVQEAEEKIQDVEESMKKSMEVAKIFQDKIPHEEIIDRQNTVKFVRAAAMAHKGKSVDEISSTLGLSRGEAELIANLNREELTFNAAELPEWVKSEVSDLV